MYQPTNVTPSSLTGESTVDVADNVNITWQINGDVPLAAFQIDFYQNNAVSTKLYSTGLLTDNCPADGVDGQGKPILFSYQPSVPWSTYGLTNGNDYKYKITQFWSANLYVCNSVPSFSTGGNTRTYYFYMNINGVYYCYMEKNKYSPTDIHQGDKVTLKGDYSAFMVEDSNNKLTFLPTIVLTTEPTGNRAVNLTPNPLQTTLAYDWLNQYSDNVFLTRTTPTLSINAFTEPLNKIVNTFTATYTQAEGDTVKWIKWVLTDNTQSVILEDTGEISTYVFSYTYNGFMNGNNYTITCTAETENGVQVTASETFDVSYTMPEAEGTIKLSCNSDSSVTLSWAQASDINGLAIPESGYTINNNTLSVADGTRILWDTKNEEPLSIETPVSFAYKGYQKSFIEYKYDITLNTSMSNPIIALNPQNTLMVAAAERTAELYSIGESGATFLQKIYMDGLTTNFDGNINAVTFSPDGQYLVICGAFSSVGVVYEVSGNTLTFFDNIYSYVTSPTRCIDFTSNRNFLVSSTVESLEYYDVYKLSINDFGQRVDYIGSSSYAEMLTYIKSVPKGYLYSGESIIKGAIHLDNGTTITLTDNGTALTYPVTSAVYIGDNSEGYLIAKTSYMQGSSSYTKLIWYYYNGTTYSYFTTVDTEDMADGFEISAYNNFIFACRGGLYEFRTDEIGNRLKNLTTFTAICPIYKDNNNSITDFPNEVIVNCTTSGNGMIATLDNQGTYTLKYYALNDTVSNLTIATTDGQILQRNIFNGISVMVQNLRLRRYSVYVPFGDFSEYIWQIYSTDNTTWQLRAYSIDNDTVNYMGREVITGFLNPTVPWDIQALILNGVQTTDYLYVTSDYNYDITQNNYTPLFTANAQFYANFEDGLQAGTNTTAAGDYAVYREKNDTSLLPLGQLSTDNQKMKDYGVLNNNTYTYSMYYVDGDTYSTPLYSEGAVCQQFPAYVLMETTPDSTNSNVYHVLNVWCFGNNIEAQPVVNGNEPNFLENFTQYPYRQGSCVMARSGVLSALLSNAKDGQYADTAEQMQRLDNISLSNNIFFLKDTKGNMYQVHTSSAITQTINITSSVQEVKITIPWQEVGSAENVSIIQLPTDEGWTEEEGSQSGIFKTQSKTVLLDMANGDQTVTPDTNYLLNSVTVRKPATLQPSNILKGVNIGGVIGTAEKDIVLQEKTVSVVPNEDMTVLPDVGYDGLSEVNINKINTETVNVQSTDETQTITPPENYYYNRVVVYPPTTEPKTVDITENGTTTITPSEAGVFFDNVTVNVNVPAPQPIEPKDYNFFDWDGKLLYAYSADEINALTELPALPIHEGLTGEWNYTLAQLQSLTQLARPLPANVGCIVKTTDGSTLLEIEIPEGDTKRNVELNFPCSAGSTAVVNWGDGTTETVTATGSYIAQSHIYADNTTYAINIDFTSGSYVLNANLPILGTTPRQCGYLRKVVLGTSDLNIGTGTVCRTFNNQYNLEEFSFGGVYSSVNQLRIPRNFTSGCSNLKAIHLPVGTIMINPYALQSNGAFVVTLPIGITNIDFSTFTGMSNLHYLALPNGLATLMNYPFAASGLGKLIIPNSVTNENTWFQNASNISYVELPTALTSIPANFMSLSSTNVGEGATISELKIPSGVTSIGASAFSGRKGILVFDFSECLAVPTLANVNAFNAINDYAVIIVPDSLYNEWIAATNWATYAAKIVKASEYDG